MPWVPPIIHATGDVFSISDNNNLANNEFFLWQKPYIMAYNSVATSLTNAANTQVTLGGLTASGYGFSVSSNNLIVPVAGIYAVFFGVALASASQGTTTTHVVALAFHNGTQTIQGSSTSTDYGFVESSGSGLISCSASDTIGLFGNQDTGIAQNTLTSAASTFMHAFLVGSI